MGTINNPESHGDDHLRPDSDRDGSAGKAASQSAVGEEDTAPDDSVEDELEKAREHADPSRGDKGVDGGDKVSTEQGGNPQE